MIKLEVKNLKYSYRDSHVFYFKNIDDCNEFKQVFKDHWCNIRWEEPVEIHDNTKISDGERKQMNRNPKERAESDLSWGFSLEKGEGWDKLNSHQNTFVNRIVEQICW